MLLNFMKYYLTLTNSVNSIIILDLNNKLVCYICVLDVCVLFIAIKKIFNLAKRSLL